MQTRGSSSLPQLQQTTSPDGSTPTPEADVLPEAVMFPIISERGGAGDGTPGPAWQPGMVGADRKEARRSRRNGLPSGAAEMFGRMDALEGNKPMHKDHYAYSKQAHGKYLRAWNAMAGTMDGTADRPIMTKDEYTEATGRPDLYTHYQNHYWTAHMHRPGVAPGDDEGWEYTDDASRNPRMGRRTAAVPGTPGGACPACGSHNTTVYAHESECNDCGHTWGSGRTASVLLPSWWYANSSNTASTASSQVTNVTYYYPGTRVAAGEYRPEETLPTGEKTGDSDFDYGSNIGPVDKSDRVAAGRCGACGRPTKGGMCQGCKMPTADCTCVKQAARKQADFMTRPHQSTDDFAPVPNSPATSPDPWSQNEDARSADFQAGFSEGQSDARAGNRPTFMDNSPRVSEYVSGYAQGYSSVQPADGPDTGGHPGAGPRQNPDVPRSMGGDSGQAQNAQRAQTEVQVAKASISRGFVSTASARHPDFRKAYAFASRWKPGSQLVSVGNAYFEAGLYAGISDRPAEVQRAWIQQHGKLASRNQGLRDRIMRHASFSESLVPMGYRVRKNGVYAWIPQRRTAGTTTDLITDGPGTSPDPMGSTPLNGPGTPPPSAGRGDPARPGGPPPQQGGQSVVQDDVVGPAQEPPQPVGPLAQGFSGPGAGYGNQNQIPPSARGNQGPADLAPAAPNAAAQTGYSNPDAYKGAPQGGDRTAAFRARVQASLRERQASGPKAR